MKYKTPVLKIQALALSDRWKYKKDDLKRISQFRQKYSGKNVDITFEAHDSVQYWQHQYYRGYVLPAIAEGQGERDLKYLHEFVLKEEFLFLKVNNYKDIPPRHYKKCRIITADVIYEDGEVIRELTGYVPSTSVLNFKEMKQFILNCEDLRDGLIGWSYSEKDKQFVKDYKYHRAMAFKEELKEAA